ncbi:hypothetical protein CR513_37633, partial [Mucuna pruriens]
MLNCIAQIHRTTTYFPLYCPSRTSSLFYQDCMRHIMRSLHSRRLCQRTSPMQYT